MTPPPSAAEVQELHIPPVIHVADRLRAKMESLPAPDLTPPYKQTYAHAAMLRYGHELGLWESFGTVSGSPRRYPVKINGHEMILIEDEVAGFVRGVLAAADLPLGPFANYRENIQ